MKLIDPESGKQYFPKRRRRYDRLGHARELTFSCYRRYRFLETDRVRLGFLEALEEARRKVCVDLWAYGVIAEHVHLLIHPQGSVSKILREIKEPVVRRAIAYLKQQAP